MSDTARGTGRKKSLADHSMPSQFEARNGIYIYIYIYIHTYIYIYIYAHAQSRMSRRQATTTTCNMQHAIIPCICFTIADTLARGCQESMNMHITHEDAACRHGTGAASEAMVRPPTSWPQGHANCALEIASGALCNELVQQLLEHFNDTTKQVRAPSAAPLQLYHHRACNTCEWP